MRRAGGGRRKGGRETHRVRQAHGDLSILADSPEPAWLGYRQRIGRERGGACVRTVRFTAQITPPQIEDVEVDVPDEAGGTVKTEVA
jgi:hypothetical protein